MEKNLILFVSRNIFYDVYRNHLIDVFNQCLYILFVYITIFKTFILNNFRLI